MIKRRGRLVLWAAFLCVILYPAFLLPGDHKPNADHKLNDGIKSNSAAIAFVSDTQAPIWIEKLWLKSDDNEKATAAIFSALIKEKGLSALFHLGDITATGFMQSDWKEANKYFSGLRNAGIAVYPTLGNHEYFIFPSGGRKLFFNNFPYIKSSWYVEQTGSISVILLNSNFSHLTDAEVKEQQKWYEDEVRELDQNPAVKVIIAGTHYSPFTNSTMVEPSEEVQRYFVPVFLKSRKSRVFISGHSHAIEHFKNGGKDFLVIGGGGGLLHPLLMGKERRFDDLFPYKKSERRMFHYIMCEERNDSLRIKVKMINPDYRTFNDVYEIKIAD